MNSCDTTLLFSYQYFTLEEKQSSMPPNASFLNLSLLINREKLTLWVLDPSYPKPYPGASLWRMNRSNYPSSFYYHCTNPHWVNYHCQHIPKRRQKRTMILDWSASDHLKPLSTFTHPVNRMTFTVPWVVPTALSHIEYSFLMLLMFPLANQRQNTGVPSHLPDLGDLSLASYLHNF